MHIQYNDITLTTLLKANIGLPNVVYVILLVNANVKTTIWFNIHTNHLILLYTTPAEYC